MKNTVPRGSMPSDYPRPIMVSSPVGGYPRRGGAVAQYAQPQPAYGRAPLSQSYYYPLELQSQYGAYPEEVGPQYFVQRDAERGIRAAELRAAEHRAAYPGGVVVAPPPVYVSAEEHRGRHEGIESMPPNSMYMYGQPPGNGPHPAGYLGHGSTARPGQVATRPPLGYAQEPATMGTTYVDAMYPRAVVAYGVNPSHPHFPYKDPRYVEVGKETIESSRNLKRKGYYAPEGSSSKISPNRQERTKAWQASKAPRVGKPGETKPKVERNTKGHCRLKGCDNLEALAGSYLCVAHGGGVQCSARDCTRVAKGNPPLCRLHGGKNVCTVAKCSRECRPGYPPLCSSHGGGKRCSIEGCTRDARSGDPHLCIRHGGGQRCKFKGCDKGAKSRQLCITHGGGRRCEYKGCFRGAKFRNRCIRHGGGKKCTEPGCKNMVLSREKCLRHGGGKRCEYLACERPARRYGRCEAHFTCAVHHCDKLVKVRGLCNQHYATTNPTS